MQSRAPSTSLPTAARKGTPHKHSSERFGGRAEDVLKLWSVSKPVADISRVSAPPFRNQLFEYSFLLTRQEKVRAIASGLAHWRAVFNHQAVVATRDSLVTRARPGLFPTYFLSGFECSTFAWRSAGRRDLCEELQHYDHADEDYAMLRPLGIAAVREGIP
jgi:hypothetical protein